MNSNALATIPVVFHLHSFCGLFKIIFRTRKNPYKITAAHLLFGCYSTPMQADKSLLKLIYMCGHYFKLLPGFLIM